MTDNEIKGLISGYIRRIERRLEENPGFTERHGLVFALSEVDGEPVTCVRGRRDAAARALLRICGDSPEIIELLRPAPEGADATTPPAGADGKDTPKPARGRGKRGGGAK